jgi:abequosyltransferase
MQVLGDRSLITQPLLTIAVPTYNRDFFLELCLKRIYDELLCLNEDWRGLVNVYVSDNASTDGTIAILAKYQSCSSKELN